MSSDWEIKKRPKCLLTGNTELDQKFSYVWHLSLIIQNFIDVYCYYEVRMAQTKMSWKIDVLVHEFGIANLFQVK